MSMFHNLRTIRRSMLLILPWVAVWAPPGFSAPPPPAPRVFQISPSALAETKRRLLAGDKTLAPAMGRLGREAEKALKEGPFTVTTATAKRPSGDPHDYISLSTYFWPDPAKPDGLPWMRKDGQKNPEIDTPKYCKVPLSQMAKHVTTLSLAWYLTGREEYAAHAATLLRVFFLAPATKMNPNLNFAQFVPGEKSPGRPSGNIDTHVLIELVDAIGQLGGAAAWTSADQTGMEAWFSAYVDWLLTSKNGLGESKAANNHGTWYDSQVVSFALFARRTDLAKRVLAEAPAKRIATQIEADGAQPQELRRTKSFDYSLFNLNALMTLATLGQAAPADLWNYQSPKGGGIRKALDWLVPYTIGGKPWQHQQITTFKPDSLFPLLRRAAIAYQSAEYERMAEKLAQDDPASRVNLVYPAPEKGQFSTPPDRF